MPMSRDEHAQQKVNRKYANFEWYASVSRARASPPRCPFAAVRLCPKFFFSLTILADGKQISDLDGEVRTALEEKWREHQPAVAEDSPGWAKTGDDSIRQVWGICPEVGYDVYGRFASYISTYPDEVDRDLAHRRLKESRASEDDPRWTFATVIPEHYTECRQYSVLRGATPTVMAAGTVVNVHGSSQTHVNLQSTDASVSVLDAQSQAVFEELRCVVREQLPANERAQFIERIAALEAVKGKAGFLERYKEFMELAAAHITVIGPFLRALTPWLSR